MISEAKSAFLQHSFCELCSHIDPATPPAWGKMNPQQMIEHMSDYVRIANGKTVLEVITETERLPRMTGFLMSEKPFPENTPNVLMPDVPPAERQSSLKIAIEELQSEIEYLFDQVKKYPDITLANPFFGVLNWEQQVQLLHKHAIHHLRQFGIIVDPLS